jgi:hypothetical protein
MIHEKIFPQYVFKRWHRWAASEFSVAAQAVVADPDGHSSVTLWIAFDLCLRFWRWAVHLYSFLSQSAGVYAPQGFLPWLDPY